MKAGWRPQSAQALGLTAMLAVGAAPHLLRLPLELAALWLLAVGWRLRLMLEARPKPSAWLRGLMTLAVGVALFATFGTVLGREAGSALLVLMTGLKLLELQRRRDATLLVLLAYLLIAVQFMFARSVWAAGYAAVAITLITATWIGLERDDARPWRANAALALRLLAPAVPLMLLLFLLFPRLPGPLWALPSDTRARTGLSGEMTPGGISELALSEAVAFRVDFAGPLPPAAQRYWRGPVFEFTDGRRWWGAESGVPAAAPVIQPRGDGYRYVITLEPSGTRWLPALELATSKPADAVRLPNLELRALRPVDAVRRDAFESYPDYRIATEHPTVLQHNLHVPSGLARRVRELARAWRGAAADDRDVIEAALRHFNREPFVYTLNPPRLGADPTEEFLFETRRGFCEHYASAFTLLMRAAGLPARVVTGYQGGELNSVGGYLVVRQSDAHAWAEVWVQDSGWVRVDPTAAVAPERIDRRIDPAWADVGDEVRFRLERDTALAQTLQRLRFAVDALNNGWNQWVLDYGVDRQRNLLASWGLRDTSWKTLAWLLAIGLGAVFGAVAWLLLHDPRRADPVARSYARFRAKLMRRGVDAPATEGPSTLLARIERTQQPAAAAARRIVDLYIGLRYAPEPDARRIKELRRAVRQFR